MLNNFKNETLQGSTLLLELYQWPAITNIFYLVLRLDNKKVKSLENIKSFRKRQNPYKFWWYYYYIKSKWNFYLIMVKRKFKETLIYILFIKVIN